MGKYGIDLYPVTLITYQRLFGIFMYTNAIAKFYFSFLDS